MNRLVLAFVFAVAAYAGTFQLLDRVESSHDRVVAIFLGFLILPYLLGLISSPLVRAWKTTWEAAIAVAKAMREAGVQIEGALQPTNRRVQ
jgi:hypothetical protein